MSINLTPKELWSWFLWICAQIVIVGLLVAFVAIVAKMFGFDVPFVRPPNYYDMALLCGAWYLLRKAG